MPNFAATLAFKITFTNNSGFQTALPSSDSQISVDAQYQAQNVGAVDVPNAAASGTSYVVPFGSISADARGVFIKNDTGQPLELTFNGAMAASFTLGAGGIHLVWNPATSGATPLLQVSCKTTAVQSGAGYITYGTFGDPAP